MNLGKQYLQLNIELNKAIEKKEIEKKIDDIQKERGPGSDFHLWPKQIGKLENAIQSFTTCIQSHLKLLGRHYTPIIPLLKAISGGCKQVIDVFEIRYDTDKYKGVEKVKIGEKDVEIERIKDLEKGLDNIVQKIDESIEKYDELINYNSHPSTNDI